MIGTTSANHDNQAQTAYELPGGSRYFGSIDLPSDGMVGKEGALIIITQPPENPLLAAEHCTHPDMCKNDGITVGMVLRPQKEQQEQDNFK